MITNPKVTVLMPVYNGEKYIKEAIESILKQTFRDFEFLIIDDGSSDKSVEMIQLYEDKRIRLIHNERNIKLIATLNKGLILARGEYIVRMDCDDISLPHRIERQVEYMDKNPDVGVCGTWVKTIRNIGSLSFEANIWKFPVEDNHIKSRLLFNPSFAHPSVILRKTLLEKNGLSYDPNSLHAEDFELWKKCSKTFRMSNIPEVLVKYRITSQSVSHSNKNEQLKTLNILDKKSIEEVFGFVPSEEELQLHRHEYFKQDIFSLTKVHDWLMKLLTINSQKKSFPNQIFSEILAYEWLNACSASRVGYKSWILFNKLLLSKSVRLNNQQKLFYKIKCLYK